MPCIHLRKTYESSAAWQQQAVTYPSADSCVQVEAALSIKVFRILLLKTNLGFRFLSLGFLIVTFLTDMLVGIIQRRKTDTSNIR